MSYIKENAVIRFGLVILIIVILSVLLLSFSSRKKPDPATHDPVSVRIAVSKTPLSSPMIIAQEKGFFQQRGVEAEISMVIGGHRALNRLFAGEADVSTVSETPVVFNSFERDDYAVFGTFVHSYNDVKIISQKDSGIETAKDLRKKTVAVIPGTSSEFFLNSLLIEHEVPIEKVNIVAMQPEEASEKISSGAVDAITIWEPFAYQSKNDLGDDAIVLPHNEVYRETFNAVAMEEFIQSEPEAIRRVLRALDDAQEFIATHPEESQQIVAEKIDAEPEFISSLWSDFHFSLFLDQPLIVTMEQQADWAIQKQLVKGDDAPNYLQFISMDALLDVNEKAVSIIR